MVQKKYFTFEELSAAKKKNALNTYYRKVARDSVFISQKKEIRLILNNRDLVQKLHKYLITIQDSKIS